jgi:hypothetical protein
MYASYLQYGTRVFLSVFPFGSRLDPDSNRSGGYGSSQARIVSEKEKRRTMFTKFSVRLVLFLEPVCPWYGLKRHI